MIDTSKRVKVVAEGITQSITTYPMTQARAESYKKPGLNCVPDDPNPPRSVILGYKVVKQPMTRPDGNQRIETWLAPDLACVILQSKVFGRNDHGADVLLSSKEAVSITTGEPNQALFTIPNWPERSPSEVFAAYGAKFRMAQPSNPGLDNAYLSAQRHK